MTKPAAERHARGPVPPLLPVHTSACLCPLLPDTTHAQSSSALRYPLMQGSTQEYLPHGVDHFCSEVGVGKLVQGGNGTRRVEAVSLHVHNRLVVAVLVRPHTP